MLKRVISAVIGTRHERERKKIQPIVDEINEQWERLKRVSDDELRGQTAKFREILREKTGALETRVADLKEQKHSASDAVERDRIDTALGRSLLDKGVRMISYSADALVFRRACQDIARLKLPA